MSKRQAEQANASTSRESEDLGIGPAVKRIKKLSLKAQFEIAQNPTEVISTVRFAPKNPNRLIVSSWDKHLYLYDINAAPGGKLLQKLEQGRPILDVCWGRDENEVFSCGLDCTVKRVDLTTGEQTVMSTHDMPARNVIYSPHHKLLISGSWDMTLHLHSLDKEPGNFATVKLPAKSFSLGISPTRLVVGMSNRAVSIYELDKLQQASRVNGVVNVDAWQVRESSMKYMTRAVACMPNDAGYASSSIEGRVAVEWFDPSDESQARKYAFKCHRQVQDGQDVVYPVHALAFHPVFGTFASGGGDGVVALWDGVAKRRIRQYQRFPASISSLAFSGDGKYLAIGVSNSYETTTNDIPEGPVKVYVRELGDTEAQGKKK